MERDRCDVCGKDAKNLYFYNPGDLLCPHNADPEQGIILHLCNICHKKYNERDRHLIVCVKATQKELE